MGVLTLAVWTFILLMSFINIQLPPTPPLVVINEPPSGAENSPSPYVNTFTVLLLITVGGVIFITILIYVPKIAAYISIIIFWLITFLSLTLYGLLVSYRIGLEIGTEIVITSLFIAILLTWLIRKGRGILPLISASITSAAGGVLIGSMLPPVTALILLISISLFDLLMVKKGYLSIFGKEELKDKIMLIKGMIVNYDQLTLGLGDLVFYSILISNMYFQYGFLLALLSNIGITIGFALTLILLKRSGIAPGLTIPLFLGLCLALIGRIFT